MMRRLHSVPGLVLGLMLAVMAVSGAALSVVPALDRATLPAVEPGRSVADLAAAVAARHQSIDKIVVRPSGAVTAAFTDAESSGIELVDPATGEGLGPYRVSEATRWLTQFHRSFLAGDGGRAAAGAGAIALLLISMSGLVLFARRSGSWRAALRPVRGTPSQRWHGEIARIAALGLVLSSLTGLWMSADSFGLLPEGAPSTMANSSPGSPAPVGSLDALRAVDIADLRELIFPAPDDPRDVFVLRTVAGETSIDRVTGRVLAFTPASAWDRMMDVVKMLHTGRGAWLLGLVLGLCAAAVPALAGSGALIWWRRRSKLGPVTAAVPAGAADTVILVGSDGGTTWGFAATLQAALTRAGHRVHVAAMNDLAPVHASAERLLLLAATAGDGSPPASAPRFLARLPLVGRRIPMAVLGFGDRTFPKFCGFAQDVSDALEREGWPVLLPLKRVDRQSPQEFAAWGRDLGAVLGCDLVLEHAAPPPRTTELALVDREDYGAAVGAPVAILRFGACAQGHGRAGGLPTFAPGDLVGIMPPGGAMPRFYSLASASGDGVLEICVRLRPGGLCSTFLHGLRPGDRISAFVRENPHFRPAEGRTPLILIGAGAGVGPLAGFVRANTGGRPVHLYVGGRNPASDFLYEHEFAQHLAERRLTSLRTAFSRTADPAYVQDRLAADAAHLRDLVHHGAQVLVCGGCDMAHAVAQTLERVLHPLGTDLATLRSTGRYVEDVY